MDAYEYAILKNDIDKKTGQEVAQQLPDLVPPAVADYCEENFSGWSGALDRSLTQPLMAAPADKVGEINSALTNLDDAIKYYRIPTSEGTTTATTSVQTVLDNVAIKQGKSYKLTVTIASASDVALYFGYYEHGDPSYKFVMTLDAGATTKSQNFASVYNITNGYIGATTNNRVATYSISFEELGEHHTYMEENEQAIEDLSDVVDGVEDEVEALRQTIGIYEPISSSGHMVNGDGNKTILDNLSIVANRKYNIILKLKNAIDVASYISVWDGTSESYSNIFTLAAGDTVKNQNFIPTFTSDTAYIKFNASNRVLDYTIEFSDVSYEHLNDIQKNTDKIDDLAGVTETVAHNQMITRDISSDVNYHVGATAANGSIDTSQTGYVYTDKISVGMGDVVYMLGYSTNAYSRVTAYNNDAAIPSESKTNVRSFTVPSGVNQVVITVASNIEREKELIIINGYSTKVNSAIQQANNALQNFSHMYAKRTPMITFIDDDGNTECYDYLLPIFKRHNVPIVSAYMGDGNPTMVSGGLLMSREQCQEIVQNGGEIIVHYVPSLTEFSLAEAERIVLQSKDALEKNGFYSRLIVYSNGTSNSAIRAMISKHFDAAFSSGYPRASYNDRSNHDCIPQFAIHRENAGGFYYDTDPASSTLQYFKDMIDECIAANGWLVFVLHSWLMPEGQRDPRWENVDQLGLLEDIIEYVEELQSGGSAVRIVTASEGLEHFGNAWQAGDYLGYWNMQSFQSLGTLGDHTEPGSAINKLGQYDFPSVNNLNA